MADDMADLVSYIKSSNLYETEPKLQRWVATLQSLTRVPAQGSLTQEDIYANCWTTLIGFSEELTERDRKFICDQVARKVILAAQPPAAPVETKSASEMIAACYEGLCPDGSSALDFEWARQRGYILPNNGNGKLSPAKCSAGIDYADLLIRLRETPLPSLNRIGRDRREAAEAIERLSAVPQGVKVSDDSVDAARYRRLRVLGVAPAYTEHLNNGDVLRFTNLDEFIDRDISWTPSRGEA
jgi:hypothetical protein